MEARFHHGLTVVRAEATAITGTMDRRDFRKTLEAHRNRTHLQR